MTENYEEYNEMGMRELGDVMKRFESVTTASLLMPDVPVYARIDGRAFHTFCHGMKKPFDNDMLEAMQETCRHLVRKTHAVIGYVQSDEISLAWRSYKQAPFEGKLQKLTSVLAGMASAKFIQHLFSSGHESMIERALQYVPHFDCRVCNLPSAEAVELMFKWREMDAYRNAVNSVAQANFSHGELQGKSMSEVHEMLFKKGINFTKAFTQSERHGMFMAKVMRMVKIPDDVLNAMPEAARPDGGYALRGFVEDMGVDSFDKLHKLVTKVFDNEDHEPSGK